MKINYVVLKIKSLEKAHTDIDVLVPSGSVDDITELLESVGYDRGISIGYEFDFFRGNSRVKIDLHKSLTYNNINYLDEKKLLS